MTSGRITTGAAPLTLDWAVARQAKSSGARSGDGYLIRGAGPRIMLAVADGTGSGAEAADAADICLSTLGHTGCSRIGGQFDECHAALRGGRGAALGIAVIDLEGAHLTWASVGDIDGLLLRAGAQGNIRRRTIFQRGGTLGILNPGVHLQRHGLEGGDVIVMTTDGVSRRYRDSIRPMRPVERMASDTLSGFGNAHDDRLVLALGVGAAR